MRVDARLPQVRRVNKGTPHRLVMKVVKVGVFRQLSNQVNADFALIMRKRAIFPIVAQTCGACVALAELGLVFVGVVEFFNARVAVHALVALSTLFLLGYQAAQFARVG